MKSVDTCKERSHSVNLRKILLYFSTLLLSLPLISFSRQAPRPQKYEISGQVLSATDGQFLPGATVRVKGSLLGVNADEEGVFNLTVSEKRTMLTVSHMGYYTKDTLVQLPLLKPFVITLEQKASLLNQVVVNAGYYSVTDQERTGSISRITAETIAKQPVTNPLQALQGRIPGMRITQQTGVPGGGFIVRIRGQNSIMNGNEPLYIVDGVPYPAVSLSSAATAGNIIAQANPLYTLNPRDIESIEILKDADATAIYGSRGANGVILITTKQGQKDRTSISVNLSEGIGQVGRKIDLLNTQEYLTMRNEAFSNDGVAPGARDYDVNGMWDMNRYTDWQKELIGGTANYTNAHISLNEGGSRTSFSLSGAFNRETTVFPGDLGYRRGSGHLHINHTTANKKLRLALSALFSGERNNLMDTDLSMFITTAPNAPALYDESGNINWEGGTFNNPLSYLLKKYRASTENLNGNLLISYKIVPNLTLKSRLGYTSLSRLETQTNPLSSFNPALGAKPANAHSYFANNRLRIWTAEPQLSWEKQTEAHHFQALIGSAFQREYRAGETLVAYGFNSESMMESLAAAATISPRDVLDNTYSYAAVFGRLNYNWKRRYYFNLTGRRDGSSRFGPENRFSNFGAVGFAWIFSNEDFAKKALPILSFGKLRGSYGITGNDQIGDYEYLNLWSTTDYPYQGNPGLYPLRIHNATYSWEKNRKLEIALDLGLFSDNLRFSAGYFNNRSSNQLVRYDLPPSVGFEFVQDNLPAVVENSGWEFELNVNSFNQKDFRWVTNVNLTIPRNRLVRFPGLDVSSYANKYIVNYPLSIVKALKLKGVDPLTGVYQYEDFNGDGRLTVPDDRQAVKVIGEKYYGGIQNLLSYKRWQIDFLIQFVKQTGNNYITNSSVPGTFNANQPVVVLERWQQPGDQSPIQKFTQRSSTEYSYGRVYGNAVDDASFIRLKNAYISYLFKPKWFKGGRLQAYIQGQNLITITDFIGLDPESQRYHSLPPLRVLVAGIQLTF